MILKLQITTLIILPEKNAEVEKNNLFIEKNCGAIKGVESNKFTLTLEELQLPSRLIDFISAEELLLIRSKK